MLIRFQVYRWQRSLLPPPAPPPTTCERAWRWRWDLPILLPPGAEGGLEQIKQGAQMRFQAFETREIVFFQASICGERIVPIPSHSLAACTERLFVFLISAEVREKERRQTPHQSSFCPSLVIFHCEMKGDKVLHLQRNAFYWEMV